MLSRSGVISGIGLDLLIFYQIAGVALEQGAQAVNIILSEFAETTSPFFSYDRMELTASPTTNRAIST